jgi:cation:H+ antiporter
MFEWLGLLGNVFILLLSLFILDRASDLAVDNAVEVADLTGLGKTVVGFILVAMTTTSPELSVSVLTAIGVEEAGVAIGNALGSNIVNICLILGLAFLIASLKSSETSLEIKEEVETLYFGLFTASMVPLVVIYIGYASRVIGIILIAIFAYNMYRVTKLIIDSASYIAEWIGIPKVVIGATIVALGQACQSSQTA